MNPATAIEIDPIFILRINWTLPMVQTGVTMNVIMKATFNIKKKEKDSGEHFFGCWLQTTLSK